MNQRFQDPKILTRSDVSRPFYYILASVPVVTPSGLKRKRQPFRLGFCDETTMKRAKAIKQQVLAPINAGLSLIQSQIPFREIARKFEAARIPQLAAATQAKYRAHLQNHLLPARKDGRLLDDRDLQQHVFRPAAEAVGIYHPGFGMHTFRCLNVTWRQEVGATPIEAQKAAGHASLDMTFLYTQTDEVRERDHVNRIMDRLKPTVSSQPTVNRLAEMPTESGVQ